MMAVASGVWADAVPLETAWSLAEVTPSSSDGTKKTMKEELTRIGCLGEVPASHTTNPFTAHFELHIEQGPILEATHRKIGIVHGVQAFVRTPDNINPIPSSAPSQPRLGRPR